MYCIVFTSLANEMQITFLQINARQNPQIHVQAKQERRTLECRQKGRGGFRTTPPKPEKPHTIPILPLDANAITRHQSKYITCRHIDVVSSLAFSPKEPQQPPHNFPITLP